MSGVLTEPLDLSDPAHHADPYPAYARLRADGGVHRSDRWDVWFVTGYDECLQVFADPRFDAVGQPLLRMLQAAVSRGDTSWRVPDVPARPSDGEADDRTAGRRTTGRALGTSFVDTLWPRFERDCEQTAAGLSGRVDLVTDYAIPVTTRLLADLMAVGAQDLPVFAAWAESGYVRQDQDTMRKVVRDVRELLATQAVSRLREPVSDFVGHLAANPGRLPGGGGVGAHLEFVLGTGLMISMVTHQGLVLSFSTMLNALLHDPRAYARLRADRALVPAAVEEGLRFDSSTQALGRLARSEVSLAGQTIPAGGLAVCVTGAANRDQRRFTDPETFDVDRPVRSAANHLSFGHGATSCLGASMSRRALGYLLGALVDVAPELAPAEGTELFGEFMTRGFVRLPATVHRAGEPA